jgi:amino acid transporter
MLLPVQDQGMPDHPVHHEHRPHVPAEGSRRASENGWVWMIGVCVTLVAFLLIGTAIEASGNVTLFLVLWAILVPMILLVLPYWAVKVFR